MHHASQLVVNDPSKTLVAHFHPGKSGLLRTLTNSDRPAVLEVFPAGEGMMDMVLLTFIYADEVSRRGHNPNGANGAGGMRLNMGMGLGGSEGL